LTPATGKGKKPGMSISNTLFCFGLGYSAQALIAHLRQAAPDSWRFAGTCRSDSKADAFAAQGIDAQVFDGSAKLIRPDILRQASHVLISAPAEQGGGDPVLRQHADDFAKHEHLKWLGYLSTTGVYGDHGGAWVDESMPMTPSQERGRRRAEAEAAWLDLHKQHGQPVHTFRLAGIYGPGRNALVNLREGKAHRIVKQGQFFSRIYVEDIAGVLAASMQKPNPGAAYNVADDEPAPPQDVIAHAAQLLGIAPPPEVPFEQAEMTPMARSFYAENKRVSNRRIKEELGVVLQYPTYREGLAALLRG